MIYPKFSDLMAGIICILCMGIVTAMFFIKASCDPQIAGFIQGILSAIGLRAAGHLWKNVDESTPGLIDALKNSKPADEKEKVKNS